MLKKHRVLPIIGLFLMTLGLLISIYNNVPKSFSQTPAVSKEQSTDSQPNKAAIGWISLSASEWSSQEAIWSLSTDAIDTIYFSPQSGRLNPGEKSMVSIAEDKSISFESKFPSGRFEWLTSSLNVSGLKIIATLPKDLVEKESSVITLSVITGSTSTTQSLIPSAGQKQEAVDTDFQSSSSVPIAETFGPGYDMFTCANLDAVNFNVAPVHQQRQSILQGKDQFNWVVAPNVSGWQTVSIPIYGIWVPKAGGQPIERFLAEPTFRFNVAQAHSNLSTSPSFFDMSPLNFGALVLTLIGAFLNVIPWVLDRSRERKIASNVQMLNSTKTSGIVSVNQKKQKKMKLKRRRF